jgi:hypothetical protein
MDIFLNPNVWNRTFLRTVLLLDQPHECGCFPCHQRLILEHVDTKTIPVNESEPDTIVPVNKAGIKIHV